MAKYGAAIEQGIDRIMEMAKGNFDLSWMDVNAEGWGHTAKPGPVGLGLKDIETGYYARVPEQGSSHGSMAPRGCYVPEDTPSLDMYTLRKLGAIDCTMVVKVNQDDTSSELVELVFEGFGAKSIRHLDSLAEAREGHFVLEASLAVWRDMIENIRKHGNPDLEHTLNYLTFPDDPMRVSGADQLEVDAFYRYNETLQRFFNGASQLQTAYTQQLGSHGR